MPPAGSGPVLAKLKTPAPSRKNDALLGKQQREARQVDLPRVDLGLAEVGVEVAVSFRLGVML